jgi:hypothetical protein
MAVLAPQGRGGVTKHVRLVAQNPTLGSLVFRPWWVESGCLVRKRLRPLDLQLPTFSQKPSDL